MISRFYILIFMLALSSCANNSSNPEFAEANTNKAIESIENNETITNVKSEIELKSDSILESNLAVEEKVKDEIRTKRTSQNLNATVKRKPSTIAEQQQAARKIQEELAARSPTPNEDKNLENAVFEKIVKKPVVKKPEPKKTTSVKKAEPVKKKKKGWPAIEFAEMKMVFDTITQGDKVQHDFIFTNTGSAPLEIKSVNVSCGCTRPSYPFIPIEPNEQGRISVTYNSVGKEGFQNPEITVYTNVSSKEIVLMMEGIVLVPEEKEEKGSNQ